MNECGFTLRSGSCRLNPGHRGRHTTAVFYCDGCGKARRGRPAIAANVWVSGEIDDTFQFCFPCKVEDQRNLHRGFGYYG